MPRIGSRHLAAPCAALVAVLSLTAGPGVAQEGADPIPEGPDLRVASVRVAGLENVTPAVALPRRLPLRRGMAYTAERVAATEQVLRRALAESGRPYAEVVVSARVDHEAGEAAVLFEVEPGPAARFGEVRVQVAEPLDEGLIRDRVTFRPGDLFRPSALERTRQRLVALPGVEDATIELPGLERGAVELPAVVRASRPERMTQVGARATLSSAECLEVAGRWRHQHFLGGPRLFAITGGFSNLFATVLDGGFPCASAGQDAYAQANYFLTTQLLQPLVAGPADAVDARVFFRRRTAPQSYLLHGFGLHVSALRELRPDVQLRLSYAPERNEVRAAGHYFCVNFGACDDRAIARLAGWRWLAPVEAAVHWVPPAALAAFPPPWVREAGLWPGAVGPLWRPMARLAITAAAGPTGSDFDYVRAEAEAAVARVLTPRTELAGRLRAGAVPAGDRLLPPQVRFYSGGPTTVRGARQNLLAPLVLVARAAEAVAAGCQPEPDGCPPDARPAPHRVSVRPRGGVAVVEANLEARLWLTRSLQLAGFADAGAVMADAGPGGLEGREWAALIAPGAGIRWLGPLGPIRIDLGYDTRPARRVPMLLQEADGPGLVALGDVVWDPHAHDRPGRWRETWRRLRFHLAVGQPF
jgi:outer membrane protein insertion porin family